MTHEVKIGDPVEFWFTDEQGVSQVLNGKINYIEQQFDSRPTIICSSRRLKSAKPEPRIVVIDD